MFPLTRATHFGFFPLAEEFVAATKDGLIVYDASQAWARPISPGTGGKDEDLLWMVAKSKRSRGKFNNTVCWFYRGIESF